jgi:hypothetical protein
MSKHKLKLINSRQDSYFIVTILSDFMVPSYSVATNRSLNIINDVNKESVSTE